MSLTQMAERCPGSTFIGKATLRGYKWQINQRHVANIVKVTEDVSSGPADQGDVVEGLVFSITDKDRRTLDRKEGIKLGVYERIVLNVLLVRHPNLTEKKTAFVRDRLQDESYDIGENAANPQPKLPVLSKKSPPSVRRSPAAEIKEIEAITYLSTKYTDDGLIRLEYVQRMENAINDAVKLNMSRDFVERYLEPYINGDVYQPEEDAQEKPSISNPSVSQTVPEERKRKTKSGPVPNLITMASRSARRPERWYYFAYGSNMSLKQMAERCPSSLFKGKGRIEGYRWQINQRGVANIVESRGDYVEGLVYQIDANDKRKLNRSEGVALGFYNDEHLHTLLVPLLHCGIKTFHVAKELEMDGQLDIKKPEHRPASRYPGQESLEMVEALVYVSREYKDDGLIRSEYIARMEKAIIDGRKMGLSEQFLTHIDRTIHRELPRPNNSTVRTNYGPSARMEAGGTSHQPYGIL